jgi:hypothetical protein
MVTQQSFARKAKEAEIMLRGMKGQKQVIGNPAGVGSLDTGAIKVGN